MIDSTAPGAGLPGAIESHIGQAEALLGDSTISRVDALHDARKQLKRARALLRLNRGIQASLSREFDAQLRTLAMRLGSYRDADAMLEAIDRLAAIDSNSPTLLHARERLTANRDALLDAAPGYTVVAAQVSAELAQVRQRAVRQLSSPNEKQLELALAYSVKALRRARKDAKHLRDAEAFHRWRKRAKTLLYQSQWLTPKRGGLSKRRTKRLNRLAELLGQHHDLHVLRLLLDQPDLFHKSARTASLRKLLGKQYRRIEKRALGFNKIA